MSNNTILLDPEELERVESRQDFLYHLNEYDTARKSKAIGDPELEAIKESLRISMRRHFLSCGMDETSVEFLQREKLSMAECAAFKKHVMGIVNRGLEDIASLRSQIDDNKAQEANLSSQNLGELVRLLRQRSELQDKLDKAEAKVKPYLDSSAEIAGENPTLHNFRKAMVKLVYGFCGALSALCWSVASILFVTATKKAPDVFKMIDPSGVLATANGAKALAEGIVEGGGISASKSAFYWLQGTSKGKDAADKISRDSLDSAIDRATKMLVDEEISEQQSRHKILPHRHTHTPDAKSGTFHPVNGRSRQNVNDTNSDQEAQPRKPRLT